MNKITSILEKSPYLFGSFLAGFSVMTVEIISSRIVAPMVGSSVFTWTSIIGITLLGLSLGSWFGGKVADRTEGRVLGAVFFISSIFIFLIPILAKNTDFILQSTVSVIWSNVLLSAYLFLIPATVLGMIQPILLKKSAIDHARIGRTYGNLSAAWSIGSVLGVFLTGFFFISYFGSLQTVKIVAVMVFLLGLFFTFYKNDIFVKNKLIFFDNPHCRMVVILCSIAIILGILNFFDFKRSKNNLVYESETDYFKVRIADLNLVEFGKSRVLFLDFDSHSIQSKGVSSSFYPEMYPVFGYLKPNIKDILVIGAGAYTLPKYLKSYYKGSSVSVIESDSAMEEIGKKYFDLNTSEILTKVGDARLVLPKETAKYDLIFGDAFNSFISVPWFLMTKEWNEIVRSKLTVNGVYAINIISALSGPNSALSESVTKTFKLSFPNYYVFSSTANPTEVQNIVLIGVNGVLPLQEQDLRKKLSMGRNPFLQNWVREASNFGNSDTVILTNEYSPVEKLMTPLVKNYFVNYGSWMEKVLKES